MSVRIGLGLAGHPFKGASDLWEWVGLCDDSAVDSLWQSDRLISKEPLLEPMSLMAALAGRTRRLKFGMSAVSISFRDPLVLAKECATIDYLSGGRLLPAFGLGAPQLREWSALGTAPKGRGRRADEALELLARLWEEDDVCFEGEFYRYDGVSISPKPVQRPLPLWIGGSSPAAIRRTARLGTGWLAGIQTAAQVAPVVEAIQRELERCGRSIDPDHYGAGFSYRFGSRGDPIVERTRRAFTAFQRDLEPEEYFAVGGAEEILAQVERYKAAGISKFVLRPLADGMADLMEQTRRLIEEILPEAHA